MRFKKQKKICSALIITLTAALVMPNGGAVIMPNTGQQPMTVYADTGDPPAESTIAPQESASPEEPPDEPEPTVEPEPTGDPNKAWIIEDFMGVADDTGSIEPKETGVPKLEKDNIIWLGIAFDNLEMFYPGLQMGISNMELALNYDPKYIAPCSKSGKVFTDFSTAADQEQFISDWLDYIAEYNLKTGATAADVQKWDADVYQFYEGSTPCTKVNLNKQATNNDEMTADMQMMYLNIGRKSDVETADWRLKNLDASQNADTENEHTEPGRIEKKYMMMLPFKIMFNPETTPVDESKPYLKLSLGPQTFVMGFGDEGYSDTAKDFAKITVPDVHDPNLYGAWENAEHTGGMRAGINLQTYLDFVKEINIFETTAIPDELLDIMLGYELTLATAAPEGGDGGGDDPGFEDVPTPDPNPQTTFVPVELHKEFTPPLDPLPETPTEDERYGVIFDPDYIKDEPPENPETSNRLTYYVELPPEAKQVQLTLERSVNDEPNTPDVWFSNDITDPYVDIYMPNLTDPINQVSMPIDAAMTDTGTYLYHNEDKEVFTLSDVDMDKNDGFNNVIKITYKPPNSKKAVDYLIFIRKLVNPEIKLNYGNSPYGLIMRDDENLPEPEDKEAAKEAFCVNNRFDDPGLTPEGGITGRVYYTQAWLKSEDENINMDRNDYALFGRYYSDIKDPGFLLYNEYDELIELSEDNKVTRHIDYKVFDESIPVITDRFLQVTDGSYDDTLTGKDGEFVMPFAGRAIRPETLYIVYNYKKGEFDITAKRPLIIVQRIADINIDTAVGTADITAVKKKSTAAIPDENLQNAPGAGAVFKFRVEDVNNDLAIGTADVTAIKKRSTIPLIEYYITE